MAKPTTRQEFATNIVERLGGGVIRVNVSPTQIEHAIDDALDFFQEYHEQAEERTYISMQMGQQEIDTGIVTLPDNVKAVLKVVNPNSSMGIDDLFNIDYYLDANAVWGMIGGGAVGSRLSNFAITKQYMAEIEYVMSPMPSFRFRQYDSKLHIDKSLTSSVVVGQYIVIECHAILDIATHSKIWGDRYLRNLAVSYLKYQWGTNISKFQNIQLPSGLTMNGDQLKAEASQEIKSAEQDIRNHMEPLGIIVA